MTISGVTSGASETTRDVPAPRPRQRVSPIASATPSGTVTSDGDRREPHALEERRAAGRGRARTERSGSPEYQRSDQPCAVERERPSLNEKRIAMRIGTIDQTR